MSSKEVINRILIKSCLVYFHVGSIIIDVQEGDIYYELSQKDIVDSNFGLKLNIIEHFSFHKTGRVHVKAINGERQIFESGVEETQPKTKGLRQKIQDIGFQEILWDVIVDFHKLPRHEPTEDELDVVFDIDDYQGPVQFCFLIVSGRLIAAYHKGKETCLHLISEERENLLLDSDIRCLGFESDNADKMLQYQLYKYSGNNIDMPTGRKIFIAKDSGISRDKYN